MDSKPAMIFLRKKIELEKKQGLETEIQDVSLDQHQELQHGRLYGKGTARIHRPHFLFTAEDSAGGRIPSFTAENSAVDFGQQAIHRPNQKKHWIVKRWVQTVRNLSNTLICAVEKKGKAKISLESALSNRAQALTLCLYFSSFNTPFAETL